MTHIARTLGSIAVAAGLLVSGITPVSTDQSAPVTVPGIDKPVVVVTNEVLGNETWTNDRYWVLRGAVFVRDGAVLNISAGTTIIGESGSVGTLVVERGGRINALGTREQPIVFTSDQAPGERARGDWGGLILNGFAPVNTPGGESEGEGDTGIYGGSNPNDNSGILRFVRVEFAGVEFTPDNELNGIAFQGVGRGTVAENIQVHMNRDDGVEFFGGTVDIKRVVLSNIADDAFDWTFGWIGRAQFVAIHKRGDDSDWSIEADNNEFGNNLLPRSNPQIYNFTSCGAPNTSQGTDAFRAVLFRRGTGVTFRNFVIFGSRTLGMQISDQATIDQINNNTMQIGAGVVFGSVTNLHASVAPFVASGRFPDVRTADPGLTTACFNSSNPDFRPASAATLAGGLLPPIQPPADGFFEPVDFIGAVPPPPQDDWTTGWTSYPQN